VRRALSFYSLGVPTYLRYRHLQAFHPDDVGRWDELHREAAAAGLGKIKELRGFYVKTGQMCATNVGNAFPHIWRDTMAELQDRVPPEPFATVEATVEEGLGRPLGEVFASFEQEPIGAASIGQVHRATLRGSGERVVVKVQYPEVERVFRADVRALILFCEVAQPVHVPALREIEEQFMTEFDYREEAAKLGRVRANLLAGGWIPGRVDVPEPRPDLCSKNVLVMAELPGEKLADGLRRDAEKHAEFLGAGALASGGAGATKAGMDALIAAQDAKRRLSNLRAFLRNSLLFWRKPLPYAPPESLPANHARLLDELIDVHGHEIFVDGYFNADPHPGNVLLLPGKTLGLIDYGQTKELTRANVVTLSRMMVALQEEDDAEIARIIQGAGYRTERMDPGLAAK
jgi:aarF domain-containing kinase